LKEKQSEASKENTNSIASEFDHRQNNESAFPSHSSVALEANVKLSQNIEHHPFF
jgi:hypothetical protein